jgi:hypothetical protein
MYHALNEPLFSAFYIPPSAFLCPPPSPLFTDQFAVHPAWLAFCCNNIIPQHSHKPVILTKPYVIVISLDFSKAFDTDRHTALMEKLAALDLQNQVYNWLVTSSRHSHCTVYCGQMSTLKTIAASIVIGPAAL